jgi:hypothetical protein
MQTVLTGLLLTHAATGEPLAADQAFFKRQSEAEQDRQLHWLLQGGLGPLLHHAMRAQADDLPVRWREALLAADLTARVRWSAVEGPAAALIDTCAALDVELTLLKGISVSAQLYPEPHLRPMADIDLLLPSHLHPKVVSALTSPEGGFERVDFPVAPGLHHDEPLRHRAQGLVVELHKALFPSYSPLSAGKLFAPDAVLQRCVPAIWLGRPVRRLPAELQLPYIAAAWFNDLTDLKVQPSFLPSLFDAVLLLRHCGAALDWQRLQDGLDNTLARGCLYALLAYLPRFGVASAPADFMAWLAREQDVVGPLQLRLIHRMLDHHLIGARPWTYPFPPPVPGRYSPQYQWRKRVLG